MGNKSYTPSDYNVINNYKKQQWQFYSPMPLGEIWRHQHQNIFANVYQFDLHLDREELLKYEYRFQNHQSIVRIHAVKIHRNQELCSEFTKTIVLTQHIPFRMKQLISISDLQALTIMKASFTGFNLLSTLSSLVEPHENLICFNAEGRPKVWLNGFLATNEPEKYRLPIDEDEESAMSHNRVTKFVKKICSIVRNKLVDHGLANTVINKIMGYDLINYFEASNLVSQYAEKNNIRIPLHISNPKLSDQVLKDRKRNSQEIKQTQSKVQWKGSLPIATNQTTQVTYGHQTFNQRHQTRFQSPAQNFYSSRQQSPATTRQQSPVTTRQQSPIATRHQSPSTAKQQSPTTAKKHEIAMPQCLTARHSPRVRPHSPKAQHQIVGTMRLQSPRYEAPRAQSPDLSKLIRFNSPKPTVPKLHFIKPQEIHEISKLTLNPLGKQRERNLSAKKSVEGESDLHLRPKLNKTCEESKVNKNVNPKVNQIRYYRSPDKLMFALPKEHPVKGCDTLVSPQKKSEQEQNYTQMEFEEKCTQIVAEEKCTQIKVEKKCGQMMVEEKCTQMLVEEKCTQMVVEEKCTQTSRTKEMSVHCDILKEKEDSPAQIKPPHAKYHQVGQDLRSLFTDDLQSPKKEEVPSFRKPILKSKEKYSALANVKNTKSMKMEIVDDMNRLFNEDTQSSNYRSSSRNNNSRTCSSSDSPFMSINNDLSRASIHQLTDQNIKSGNRVVFKKVSEEDMGISKEKLQGINRKYQKYVLNEKENNRFI